MDNENKELIDIQKNIVDWYPFEIDKSILDLSEESYITETLAKKFNVTKIADEDKKYDYIVFVGNINKEIERVKMSLKYLKDDGKFLLATNNGLSIKSFCVDSENTDFSKKEIEKFLDENGLKFRKFYYVYPNIEAANVLYTDEFSINSENVSRNISIYNENERVMKNENTLIKKFLEKDKDLISTFSNAFFIECSKKEFKESGIQFVSYTNMRKDTYRVKTIIKEEYAYKTAFGEESIPHIQQIEKNIDYMNLMGLRTVDEYNNLSIKSKIVREKTVEQRIIQALEKNKKEEAVNEIKKFFDEVIKKLTKYAHTGKNVFDKYNIEYSNEEVENLHFIKYGLWDLIFQNAFIVDNEYVFFDQEWYEEGLPVEFILYRAYKYTYKLTNFITIDEFYSLVPNVNMRLVELFEKLDTILQDKIRSEIVWKIHSNYRSYSDLVQSSTMENKELKKNISAMSDEFKKLLNEKDARIKFLEENMESTCKLYNEKALEVSNLSDELKLVQNSKSWKLTKPLRRFERMLRRGKNNENKR